MALKDSLQAINFYTEFDPYFYTVDNRPLYNLENRDNALADEIDKRVSLVSVQASETPSLSFAPSGWTLTRNGEGDYTIGHNLSSVNVVVAGSVVTSTDPCILYVYNITSDSFSVKTVSLSSVLTDVNFNVYVGKAG